MIFCQWHVPIDDVRCWWVTIFWAYRGEVDKAKMRADRLKTYTLPDYMPRLNKSNNYGFDPEEQRTSTYTGMGMDINIHDQWAVESLGADPGPHHRAPRHIRQGHHDLPAHAVEGDRSGGEGRCATDGGYPTAAAQSFAGRSPSTRSGPAKAGRLHGGITIGPAAGNHPGRPMSSSPAVSTLADRTQ